MKVEKKIKRVLIIDDEEEIRKFLGKTLKEKAYETDTTKNAETALEKIKSNDYDALIIDIMLPKMDGIELLKNIKKLGKNIATLMITGYPDTKKAVSAIKLGAFDYIEKPIDIRHLENQLKNAIKIKELEKIKLQQEKILLSKEFQENLLNNIPYQIVVVNNNLQVLYSNEVFFKHFKSVDIIGKKVPELVPRDIENVEQVESKIRKVLTSRQPIYERKVKFSLASGEFYADAQYVPFQQDCVIVIIHNITETVSLEEELKKYENRYKHIVNNISDYIWSADVRENGEIVHTFYSPSLEQITGYEIEKFYKEAQWIDMVHPKDKDIVLKMLSKVLEGEKVTEEYRIITKQGKVKWVRDRIVPIKNEQGKVVHIDAIVSDITKIKQAEQELQIKNKELEKSYSELMEAESRYRYFINNVQDEIIWTDKKGIILDINPAGLKLKGYKKEEVVGKNLVNFIPKRQIPKALKTLAKTLKGETLSNLKFSVKAKDGHFIPTEVNTFPYYKEGRIVGGHAVIRDIRERIKSEKEIGRIKEEYRRLAENAPMGFSRTSVKTKKYDIINKEFERQSGYTLDEFNKLSREEHKEIIHPQDRDRVDRIFEQWKKTGYKDTLHLTYRIFHRKGNIVWIDNYLFADKDENDEVIAVNQISIDITDKKRREESEKAQNLINKERAKLLSDLRQIDDIDRVLKRACECIRDSQLYKRAVMTLHNDKKEIINLGQVGLDPKIVEQARNAPPPDENLIKKMKSKKFCISRSIFIPTEAGIDFLSTQRYIKQDENIIGDNLPKDSVWQEEDALFTPLHNINKEIMGYLSVDTPFDGRRPDEQKINILESIVEAAAGRIREIQTLKNLEESERKYQDLYDNAPEMYFTVDKYGIIKSVNKLGASQLGYTVNELIGKSVLTVVHPEDKLLMERQINNIVKNPGRIHKLEFRKVRKDGSIIYVSERMSSLRDAKSDNVLLRIMCRDITEQKKLEEQASRAERLRTAGEIAGQIAHDCNNLLTPIMAYPDYIKMYLPKGHKVIKFVDQIKESARRIADINQDLLTLSRRGHYEQVLLNLNDIVNQILSEQESYPNLVIEKSLEPNLFLIKGGTFQLKRVLINLINNARESMENIGTLTIITKNVYLDKMLMGYNNIARGEYVKISINDNGCGIPEENIRKIFTPFFTTKKADKKRGSGLGLSVVNSIVQDHNGFIDIKSQVGVGTNFDIYFPICRECIKEDMKKSKLIGGNERILIVDDDELQCKVALFILKELGYQVDFVLSGEEAVEYIKDNPCDLLIIDMVMDGIDGAETYCRIKKLYSNQRAIIVSGFAKTERVIQAQNMGAGKYIRKPITRDKLGRAVREELDA